MPDLLEYFDAASSANFVFGEYDETVQLLYKKLGGAIRLQADKLIITEDDTILQRRDQVVSKLRSKFPIRLEGGRTVVAKFDYRSAMETILRHDAVARAHVERVAQMPERSWHMSDTG